MEDHNRDGNAGGGGHRRGNPHIRGARGSGDRGSSSRPQWQPKSTTPSNTESPRPVHSQFQSQTRPDIGSLKISEQKTDTIAPMRRPDNGGTVGNVAGKLLVNHFRVSFDENLIINHYNMDVKLKDPPKKDSPKKDPPKKDLSKYELWLIREKLFSDYNLVYNGEKDIFSAVELWKETRPVNVRVDETHKVIVSYLVTLTLVNKLELRKLKDYLDGRVLSIPRDVLHGLDLVMKENPAKQCVSLGRCFFPMNPPLIYEKLKPEAIAIGGFQHSLKSSKQGLALCLDYSVLAFWQKIPVLDFLATQIKGFKVSNFYSFKRDVRDALVGLKVNVTHRETEQKYTITGLTERVTSDITFAIDGPQNQNFEKETSLRDYFLKKHGKDIRYKNIPALVFRGNKANYVPMEFCVLVEGQRCPKEKLGKDAKTLKTLKNMSVVDPSERKTSIEKMVNSEKGPCKGGVLGSFGMSVNNSMTEVTAREIQPPELKLGNPKDSKTLRMTLRGNFQWNLVGKSMVEGKSVEYWAVLDFTRDSKGPDKLQMDKFISRLTNKYSGLGINMKVPLPIEDSSMDTLDHYDPLYNLLNGIDSDIQEKYGRKLQFLLCVMSHKHAGYKCLKWIAETKVGMVTQCCLSGQANKGTDQYLTNLALKINAKIGGSNVELMNKLPHFESEDHVMFIGADVNHPASRDTNSPSIAAVVATVNWPAANRYTARVCAQPNRVEKIVNFGETCYELVTYYAELNKVRPEKIVIFRDGVSESQFRMVLKEELENLKSVLKKDKNYLPSITLIVAQKRHQTRFFPDSGNVRPGTVVDTEVVHPFEFDFYLCSHHGSMGTSKPTHYHVLWDENKFSSDALQKLIYHMCFTFARCTKPVSLVPPVYYADLTAYRGRLYYDAMKEKQPDGVEDFCKLHTELENVMFFV